MTKATLIKENIELGLAYSFRDLVYYHHGGKHGGRQADMVLEEEQRILYHNLAGSREKTETLSPAFTLTHFLQQGHAYSSKAIPVNSANSHGASIETHE
jgi:hypothetical protein